MSERYESESAWTIAVPTGGALNGQTLGSYDDDGLFVTDERLAAAREAWWEAPADDFEQIDKRRWLDKPTGVEYVQPHGNPLLGGSEAGVELFIVRDGRMVYLHRADKTPGVSSVRIGTAPRGASGIPS